jgi:hypothetical protein
MANLYNTDLGGNSRKATPSSLFGTRQLKFIGISLYDYDLYTDSPTEDHQATTSYLDSNSLYSKIVTAIQEVSEIYYLGAPNEIDRHGFIFAVAADTGQWQYSDQGDIDYNEIGIDETEPSGGNPPLLGWGRRYLRPNTPTEYSAINDIVDRLWNLFFKGDTNGYNFEEREDVYSIDDFDLRELEDCGFGLMPGRFLY